MEFVHRIDWGAQLAAGRAKDIAAPVRYLFLHHSAGRDGPAEVVRGIQAFHKETRGWRDIAYQALYSPRDRKFYLGRPWATAGAHTRGYNQQGHAICVLGNYDVDPLPPHAIDDLAEFADWHGGTWGPSAYTAHREVGETACPGRNLYAVMPTINALAAGLSAGPVPGEPDDEPENLDALSHREWTDLLAKGLRR
jgi:hypothetical protein